MISKKFLALALCLILIPPSLALSHQNTSLPKVCYHDCKVGSAGYVLIKAAEGYSPFVYKDSIGIPTIGFGHALRPGEKISTPLMGPAAIQLLQTDVATRTKRLNQIIVVPLTSNQFDALASLAYNIGVSNFPTLLRYVNEQREDIHDQFLRYNKAGGRVIRGLTVRREAEADLFDNIELADQ